MNFSLLMDTVVAQATPPGIGAIAIIRISGSEAFAVSQKIFSNHLRNIHVGRNIFRGFIWDAERKRKLDDVLLITMSPGFSFTGEPVAEIQCHGGFIVPREIMTLILKYDVRLAFPGEFTRRAFMNGRLDLTQAEAIHDMIVANNAWSMGWALSRLEKKLTSKIREFQDVILSVLVEFEARLDYFEEVEEDFSLHEEILKIFNLTKEISMLLADTQRAEKIKNGFRIVLVGKTNVGKSSLFNFLLRSERAIVSDIHGTTRDFLESEFTLNGMNFMVVDTAGFRSAVDPVEKMGVERSKRQLHDSELGLWILDDSVAWDERDDLLLKLMKNSNLFPKKLILVFNKIDKTNALKLSDEVLGTLEKLQWFRVSVTTGEGMQRLEKYLGDFPHAVMGDNGDETTTKLICTKRQAQILEKTHAGLLRALSLARTRQSYDFICFELKEAMNVLGEMVGERVTDDILNVMFSKFCLGK